MHDPRRFRMTVEYDGTDFVGWQLQPSGRSVQGTLEEGAERLFGSATRVHGAGRTDTGVHARGQVAHFDAATRLDPHTIGRALNAVLPADVSVRDLAVTPADFHARFSASSREYAYSLTQQRTSLHRRDRWIVYARLEHQRIQEAAALLPGTHDFTSFSKFSPTVDHCTCHMYETAWMVREESCVFTLRANRFLKGMVRALVGGLVLVGRGRMTVGQFGDILEAKDRAFTPMLAPPHGLVLTAVNYDPEDFAMMKGIISELRAGMRDDEDEES